LERVAVPVALGIFYVFREMTEQQSFLQARSRRHIDWDNVRLGCDRPQPRERKPRVPKLDLFETHRELAEEFWTACVELGRLPVPPGEFVRFGELAEVFGSPKRALAGLLRRGRAAAFDSVQAARKNDLLVYLAASNLRRKLNFSQLPEGVREDVRTFFGNYNRGLGEGLQLLRSAADSSSIVLACEDSPVGWQDDGALYVHSAIVDRLSPVLRAYIGCGELLYGDAHQADIVKVHKHSGKVTFLSYEKFDSVLLPELTLRAKVNLRTRWVEVFDHAGRAELLYFKERFLPAEDPVSSVHRVRNSSRCSRATAATPSSARRCQRVWRKAFNDRDHAQFRPVEVHVALGKIRDRIQRSAALH